MYTMHPHCKPSLDWVQDYVEEGDVVVSCGGGKCQLIVYSLRDWILADALEVSQTNDTKDERHES